MRVDNEVLNVLSAAECLGNNLKLTGQLDRNLYTKANKVPQAGIDLISLMPDLRAKNGGY